MKKVTGKYFTKKDGDGLKKDLTRDLTKSLSTVLDAKLDRRFTELKNEIKDEQTKFLSKIYDLVDGLALEVKDNREFREITTNQIVEVEERVEKVEKKVFGVAAS